MKKLSYKLTVKHINDSDDKSWSEDYNEVVEDDMTAEQHGRNIIDFFNRTLRPFELERVFVSAIETDNSSNNSNVKAAFKHHWSKKSLVTQKGGFDIHECTNCGATGKRFGLQSTIAIDYKFRKYEFNCPMEKINTLKK